MASTLVMKAQAMVLERVGPDLYASGPTVSQDYLSFKQVLQEVGIQRLILVNGPGGDLWTGMQVARLVRDKGIKTLVSGHCMSACSLIFMAGQERAFASGHSPGITMVGIHGAHLQGTKRIDPQLQPQIYAWYKQQMGDKFDSTVINQALYDIQEASGFLRLRELERNTDQRRVPWFCPTGQTPFDQCQQHHGKDAYTLGIVTQRQTETLTLPESMKPKLGFYGRPLAHATQDRGEQLIDAICTDRSLCKTMARQTMQKYWDYNNHKALAIGWGNKGFGYWWGADDAGIAMLRALYQCNHAKNNPKLCRLVAVNDHELLQFYIHEPLQSEALLQNIKTPETGTLEKDEPGGNTPTKLRLSNEITGMTPRALHGIERWDTPDLVNAIVRQDRFTLIDVSPTGPMIPRSLNFVHGGLSFANESQETAYEERFRNMLNAAVPDPQQPVVFYCASSQCWLSVNAAMRAQKLGYTNIKWYRGGIQAWIGAGLPTVNRLPVAVLN